MKKVYPDIELEKAIEQRLKSLNYFESIDLSFSNGQDHGDLSTPVALRIAKSRKTKPIEVAEKIISSLKLPPTIASMTIAKPGFINFSLSDKYLNSIIKRPWQTPFSGRGKKQKVIVEYSAPNIAKPFSVGHLRSTIIGDAVANMYEALGDNVIRINHIGDWGTQFGKLLYAYKKWGNEEVVKNNPIAELLRLYVRFHTEAELNGAVENKGRYWFKKLEQGDEEAVRLWEQFTKWSLSEFDRIYKILEIKFDEVKGESEYTAKSATIISDLKNKSLLKESEGAEIVDLGNNMPPGLIVKKDGTSLYLTRDLAALKHRIFDKRADTIIYHVGSEQALHFKQLFEIAKMLGWLDGVNAIYAPHGLLQLPEGKMSTRKGRVIELDKILNEAVSRAYTVVEKKNPNLSKTNKEKIAHAVGIGAVKYNDLQNHRATSITFNWDKMLSLEGNSAPYIQYTYARLKSVLRKAHASPKLGNELNEDEKIIARKLAELPRVVGDAAETQSPNIVANYTYELAGIMSAYYEKYPIIKSDIKTKRHRLAVVKSGAEAIKLGLGLLGIEAPEEI